MKISVLMIARGAVIAALYAGITLLFEPISFGPIQLRVSEALTLLPLLWIDAVPGLFIGCLIANFFGGLGLIDILCGSSATLIAAVLTRISPGVVIGAAAPVAVNGIIVGIYLSFITNMPVYLTIPYVAAGEAMACFALGIPLTRELKKWFDGKEKKQP